MKNRIPCVNDTFKEFTFTEGLLLRSIHKLKNESRPYQDMQQVKIFSGLETETKRIENEINDWIKESGVKIIQITGNIAPQAGVTENGGYLTKGVSNPSDVLVIILFEANA